MWGLTKGGGRACLEFIADYFRGKICEKLKLVSTWRSGQHGSRGSLVSSQSVWAPSCWPTEGLSPRPTGTAGAFSAHSPTTNTPASMPWRWQAGKNGNTSGVSHVLHQEVFIRCLSEVPLKTPVSTFSFDLCWYLVFTVVDMYLWLPSMLKHQSLLQWEIRG